MGLLKCEICNKKKMVTMSCTCGKILCLEHYAPCKAQM